MSYLRDQDRWFIEEVLPHEPAYLAHARRLCGDADDAADLVQDAYAKLFGLETWRDLASPKAYTLAMIRNLAIQKMRRARVVSIRQIAGLDAADLADETPNAQSQTIAREQLRRLLKAVERLPDRCRQVVVMRRFEELSPQEIARRLGLSLSTLEKRLARGMFLLSQAMDADARSTVGAPAAASKSGPRRRTNGE
ncbi:RNA polymerase sigma factor [Caulobacter sp. 602-1]|uniref:RNA polymerase sigma factor n=1 Tax=Caulobacter sp. 602-1 TaxID=2492472 RepID=UPI000F63355F|nr:RNA polymerase sigma factor [Caulobacter sp. 602-1]RRN65148.1 RNA polymerase sigma factor [Caulobacter sp. 602-1]